MSPKPPIQLKSRYYLNHFEEMIEFVTSRYSHILEETHLRFVSDFKSLSRDAKCLYVRLVNRKGRVFAQPYLRYEEIADIGASVEELYQSHFVRPLERADYADLLRIQTCQSLVGAIKSYSFPPKTELPRISSARKADLINFALEHLPIESFFSDSPLNPFFAQGRDNELGFMLFLYFGRLQSSLTEFALRDLGVMKTLAFKQEFKPRFDNKETALAAYQYRQILADLSEADSFAIERYCDEAPTWPVVSDPETEVLRGKAINRLGVLFERQEDFERALKIHRLSDQHPSTERTVRLLMKRGEEKEAEALLSRMIDNPSCDHELLFAEDFHERKFKKKKMGRLTELLRNAPVLSLDESGRAYPEQAVIRYLEKQGVQACHTENVLWSQLFGLMFWHLLIAGDDADIHAPFDRRPQGLQSEAFYRKHRDAIEDILTMAENREATLDLLRTTWAQYEGTPNHFVIWSTDLFEVTRTMVTHSPPGALAAVLRDLAKGWQSKRNGYPDLMILENDQIRFAEVKAEGDQLRRNQLAQLERLKRAGFSVDVLRIQWIVDPNQDYVVVDIETTGGNAQWNRITEIGAVRVRDGKVIEEWSSLINPKRRIPGNIVSLTGITDEMVANAPTFDAVADEFHAFVDGAVFVAHRAKFDYGFLRAEYERLDQDFRCPTLCTVVEMRRHFPGLASYSLANLCAEFSIDLDSHHRALCDAKATAALLIKINEKRMNDTKTAATS